MDERVEHILRYHTRTKHHLDRYAASLGYLDWATQPDPFRTFREAPVLPLPLVQAPSPAYPELYGNMTKRLSRGRFRFWCGPGNEPSERLLARLTERHAVSEGLAHRLFSWHHPGFSVHVGSAIPIEDNKAIEDVACYLVRAPLSLKKLVYLDGQKAVLYRSKLNPFLGRNFEAMDPLEWLARLSDHIPDTGKHRTHFYAYYANRARGQRSPAEVDGPTDEDEAQEASLPSELGALDREGLPSQPPRLPEVRRPAEGPCVRHRRAVNHAHPRLSGPEPAPTGEAASDPRGRPRAGRRRGKVDRAY